MNSDAQMVPEIGHDCIQMVLMAADSEQDRGTAPASDDCDDRRRNSCKFFVGFDAAAAASRGHEDGVATAEQLVEDATGNGEVDDDAIDCADLGNSDDVEGRESVPGTADNCSEQDREDAEFDEPVADGGQEDVLAGYDDVCSEDEDIDNGVDVTDRFYDAECGDDDAARCCDSVSDSLPFETVVDATGDELPESQSDSMLCRLPARLDVVQELSDSGSEDVVGTTRRVDSRTTSPVTLSPTSPSEPDHVPSPVSSPTNSSKPPVGASVLRKSSSSVTPAVVDTSTSKSPPEYAIVHGEKVELRPNRMSSATKRVSSFRKSLIKYVDSFRLSSILFIKRAGAVIRIIIIIIKSFV